MSATEVKSKIIDKISTIKNELILEEILNLVNLESDMDSIYPLVDDERKAIELGLEDVKEGKLYSSEVADNMIQEWQKK